MYHSYDQDITELFKSFREDQIKVKDKLKERVDLFFVIFVFVHWLVPIVADVISCFSGLTKSIYWFSY